MLVPLAIAISGLVWPPVARGRDTYPLVVALGRRRRCSLLLPSIGGVLNQLQALGSQTLMPSLEAAYPWLLALAGTSLFAGFGLARRLDARDGPPAAPPPASGSRSHSRSRSSPARPSPARRSPTSWRCATGRRRPAASRFGPTDAGGRAPALRRRVWRRADRPAHRPSASGRSTAGRSARSTCPASASARTSAGWPMSPRTASSASTAPASFGGRAWTRTPVGGWATADAQSVREQTLDLQAVRTALARRSRSTAEDRGIEVIEGAPARRCRVAGGRADVPAGVPPGRVAGRRRGSRALAGPAGLLGLRSTAQLGQVAGSVNGEAGGDRARGHPGDDRGASSPRPSGAATSSSTLRRHDLRGRSGAVRQARPPRPDAPRRRRSCAAIPRASDRPRSRAASGSRRGPSTATCARSRTRSASPSGPRAGCGASSARSSCRRSS